MNETSRYQNKILHMDVVGLPLLRTTGSRDCFATQADVHRNKGGCEIENKNKRHKGRLENERMFGSPLCTRRELLDFLDEFLDTWLWLGDESVESP